MERAIAKFGEYFAEKGLEGKDLPTAIVVHELIGLVIAVSAWSACYALQPSRALLRPAVAGLSKGQQSMRLHQAYSAAMAQASATMQRMSWLRKAPGLDAGRLTVSLAESLCLRAAAKPATFVFKLWASWKVVLAMKAAAGQRQLQAATQTDAGGRQKQR